MRPDRGAGTTYQAIVDALITDVTSDAVSVGSFFPTERELVGRFNVSRTTVRRALSELIDAGWGELSPNRGVIARIGPAPRRSNVIGFIEHGRDIIQALYFKLSTHLGRHGYHLVHLDSNVYGVEGAFEYAASQQFAGAVVWSKKGQPDPLRLEAAMRNMPVIALDHSLRTVSTDVVGANALGGAYEATRHLVRLGRKRIGVTGMLDLTDSHYERFSGYLQAILDSGMRPESRDYVFCLTSMPSDPEIARHVPDTHLLEYRLRSEDRPDALFVLEDISAAAVIAAVQRCGLRVPEDVAVVAFGGDYDVRTNGIGLTSVAVDWDEYAERVVDRLLVRMDRPTLPEERFRIATKLVLRGSGGEPESSWTVEEASHTRPLAHEFVDGVGIYRTDVTSPSSRTVAPVAHRR